ncbi:MAG: tetratricopeptide repeat protein [Desulfobacterales bacterium]|nr:tetratricopeptide repeat protein [Desulfobacterales bacterium]
MGKQKRKSQKQEAVDTNFSDEGIDSRREIFFYLLIFLVALVIRAIYLWEMSDAPLSALLLGDAQSYDTWAQDISSGNWLGDRVFYQAPLYPYFLALIYTFLGRDFFIVRVIQIVIGTASCLFLARAGRYFFSKKTGVISGILIAIYPTAIFFDYLIQKAVLAFFFMSVFLYLLGKIIHSPKGIVWVLMGMVLGCMGLTRENALILIVVILIWLFIYYRNMLFKKRLVWSALFICGLAIILIPVGLRNKVVGGDFVLTTSQFGSNLYIGNNKKADGRYRPLRPDRGDWKFERQDATEIAENAMGRKLSPSDVSQYWVGQTLSYIGSAPMQWVGLLVKKWLLVWNTLEVGDAESQYVHYKWSFVLKWLGFFFHFGVICPLAVFGIYITWRYRQKLWVLYLVLISFAASVAVFYVFSRYRFPMIGVVVLFAAAGITGSREFFKEKKIKPILICMLLVFKSAIIVNWKLFSKDEFIASTYYNIAHDLSVQGDSVQAAQYYQDALQLSPGNAMIYNNLGLAFFKQGKVNVAISQFNEALQIEPNSAKTHNNLAIVLATIGETDGAIEHFLEVIRIDPDYSPSVYFNLAGMYSRQNKVDESIKWLNMAIEKGYANWDLIKTDKDLDNIRNSSHYKRIVKGK